MRVVQIDPGPMPTLMPSANFTSSSAASRVAILPTRSGTFPIAFLIFLAPAITFALCPCAESMEMRSAPAATRSFARSISNGPQAAPTRAPFFFASFTIAASSSAVLFRWMMASPPSAERATAILASETRSIAAEIIGICSLKPFASSVETCAVFGSMALAAG